jgi:GMP synthase (glutamine-hydrolysing)
MRVAIVENTRVTHHGQVGVALHEAAALIDIYRPGRASRCRKAVHADALVVFGGEQSAVDDHTHPYLPELAKLMAAYTAMDRPVLGICLGSSFWPAPLAAKTTWASRREFGWVEVT